MEEQSGSGIVPKEVMQKVYKRRNLFQFRVRDSELECIQKRAKKNKLSASEYVRNLVMLDCCK
jgi:hypothetical protein